MAEPAYVTAIREFQDDLAAKEEAQMRLMAQRWLKVERSLDGQIDALAEQIHRLRAAGQPVNEAKLLRMERYHKLLAETEAAFGEYAEYAGDLIRSRQLELATSGLQHAVTVLDIANIGTSFTHLNKGAVESMVGLAGDGNPIGNLLRERMVKDATGLPLPGTLERLTQTLVNATAQGWNPRRTANLMKTDLSGGLGKALQIARTEQMRVYRQSSLMQYRVSGVVTGLKRLCAHQSTTCLACLAAEGRIYPLSEGIYDHVNGRCTGVPVIVGVDEPMFSTGEEWLAEQSEDVQRSIMGNTRYEMWKSGTVTFDQFATKVEHATWGPSLQEAGIGQLRG